MTVQKMSQERICMMVTARRGVKSPAGELL
jgi:hypothetical protein